jgi:hypothetical protein
LEGQKTLGRWITGGIAALSLFGAASVAAGALTTPAHAGAPVRDCGNYGLPADGPMWTYDYEFSGVRCTASRGRVIHWQAGS